MENEQTRRTKEELINMMKQKPDAQRPKAPTLVKDVESIIEDSVTSSNYMKMQLSEWRKELAWQCGVYFVGEFYLAKSFHAINYITCSEDKAKEICRNNLYALLRFKYFKKITDAVDKKIDDIIKNFIQNLATTLKRVSFDPFDDCLIVKHIPDYCVAFKNGVFDFKANDWMFKYDIEEVKELENRIYSYDNKYIIQWYMDFDFEPISEFNVMEMDLKDVVDLMTMLEEPYKYCGIYDKGYQEKNMCFELMYNMAHDSNDDFSLEKFEHLCEVCGYLMNVSFVQAFVMLIGSGRNGKNSLFDGCFTNKVRPMPTQNSMFSIENDKFITGTLEGRFHNIYLETNEKSISLGSSEVLKQLTGSEFQTAEAKGEGKRSTWLNCKMLFSANEQDKIKFGDTSEGFMRRINMYEVFYQFTTLDKLKKRNKDYFFTPFKQDLSSIKNKLENTVMFVYLAMFGIKNATKGFTNSFTFTKNDWNDAYSDVDLDLKSKIQSVTLSAILKYMKVSTPRWEDCKKMMFDTGELYMDKKPKALYTSDLLIDMGYRQNYNDMYEMLNDYEMSSSFFAENDIFIRITDLQALTNDTAISTAQYTANIKKLFGSCKITKIASKSYIKIGFEKGKIKIRN